VRRRTIGLSLLVIGLVVGMLGFGSWAVFNDTETGSATVGAGTLDLELDAGATVPGTVADLKPSEWHYLGPFLLENVGDNPGVLDLHFMNIVDSGGDSTEPEEEAEYPGPIDDISNWIDVDWCVEDVLNGQRDCNGTVIGKLGDIESRVFDLGVTLQPDDVVELWLSFHLETEAGNEYQGDQSTFDIEFTLHQTNLGGLGLPAGTTCVRLENKTAAFDPIPGDELYGSVCYGVDGNGDLVVLVEGHGLTASKWHQLTLNGPWNDACDPTDDQLASGAEQYANYDSGFWDGVGPNINQGACGATVVGDNDEGIYNFAYVQADASGKFQTGPLTIANSHEADPADAGKVTTANPSLPRGIYSDVRFIVKEIGGASPPDTSWTPVLMEMNTLNFNLP
jgi:predicted ribosomally synthesized peptide with SipW-like signal peptide